MVDISSATASTESSTAFGLFGSAIEMGNAPKYETQYRPVRSNMNQVTKKSERGIGAVRKLVMHNCLAATGTNMPYGITQCYLPPGRGDIPAFIPAEADTRFSNLGGCKAELTYAL